MIFFFFFQYFKNEGSSKCYKVMLYAIYNAIYLISIIWQYYLECHDVTDYVQYNQPINSMYSIFINISKIVYTSYILNAVNTLIMYVSVFIQAKEKKT